MDKPLKLYTKYSLRHKLDSVTVMLLMSKLEQICTQEFCSAICGFEASFTCYL